MGIDGRKMGWLGAVGVAVMVAGCGGGGSGVDGPGVADAGSGGERNGDAAVGEMLRGELSREDCEGFRAGDSEQASVGMANWGLRYGIACGVLAESVDRCNMLAGAGMDEKIGCIVENMEMLGDEGCPAPGREGLLRALGGVRRGLFCEADLPLAKREAVAAVMEAYGDMAPGEREAIAAQCARRSGTVGEAAQCADREGEAAVSRFEDAKAARAGLEEALAEHGDVLAAAGARERIETRCSGSGSGAASRACVARLAELHAAALAAVASAPEEERSAILAGCVRAGEVVKDERRIADPECAAADASAMAAAAVLSEDVDVEGCRGRYGRARWTTVYDCMRREWLTTERVRMFGPPAAIAAAEAREPGYVAFAAGRHCAWKVRRERRTMPRRLMAVEHPRAAVERFGRECVELEMGAYGGLVRVVGARNAGIVEDCVAGLRNEQSGSRSVWTCAYMALRDAGEDSAADVVNECKKKKDRVVMAQCAIEEGDADGG